MIASTKFYQILNYSAPVLDMALFHCIVGTSHISKTKAYFSQIFVLSIAPQFVEESLNEQV